MQPSLEIPVLQSFNTHSAVLSIRVVLNEYSTFRVCGTERFELPRYPSCVSIPLVQLFLRLRCSPSHSPFLVSQCEHSSGAVEKDPVR